MKAFSQEIQSGMHDELLAHLLPQDNEQEQAAFLFVRPDNGDAQMIFEVAEMKKLRTGRFLVQ